jgi:hypothetical protein
VFVSFAPLPEPGQVVFVGVGTSNLYRPEADTATDRTLVPISNLRKNIYAACPEAVRAEYESPIWVELAYDQWVELHRTDVDVEFNLWHLSKKNFELETPILEPVS